MLTQHSDQDFEFIRTIVYKLSRISLGPQKKTMVMSRISKRLRALGIDSVREYCEFLRKPAGKKELSSLVDVISTNHTYFFREAAHFDHLTKTILPEFGRAGRPFKLWSAACSSGEEPYSLAMLLMEQARVAGGFRWEMTASDISTVILEKAKAANYPESALSKVPADLRKRYFVPSKERDLHHVIDTIQRHIRFFHLNLFEVPAGFPRGFDLIVCRNVMIYFDRPTREELVAMMTDRLLPGGTLYVGHSESLSGINHTLKMVAPAIYKKES